MGGKAVEVVLSEEEREFLEAHVRKHKSPRSLSDRCRIILLCTEGLRSREIAGRTGVHEHTVGKWRRRFAEKRIEGLSDECRSGRPRTVTDDKVAEVVEAAVPEGLDVHLVMDNYATHKTEKVRAWLARRRHWHVHFTPTSASWLNLVERWFAELTRKTLRRGVHLSVAELNADIMSFIDAHNEKPKPNKWVKSADEILASVRRFCLKANQLGVNEEV